MDRVERLKRLADKIPSYSEYHKSVDWKDLAERSLQVAIEGCLDIGKIVISEKALPDPKDNKDIFAVLAQAGIIGAQSLKFLPASLCQREGSPLFGKEGQGRFSRTGPFNFETLNMSPGNC
jgi:uncharacterized protein YutE (UPF0331/DUF86 family)